MLLIYICFACHSPGRFSPILLHWIICIPLSFGSFQLDAAVSCHIGYLANQGHNGWVWSSLGQLYLSDGSHKASTQASNCFKQALKLSGRVTPQMEEWHYLGPFVIGKIEVDGDPVEGILGGIHNASRSRFGKQTAKAFSEIVPGGEVTWQVYKSSSARDYVKVSPSVNWGDLVNSLGSTGIMEWQGWAVAEFAVNANGLNIVIQCLGVHSIFVNDIPVTGDVYHREQFRFSVPLSKGIHTLYIRLRAKATATFRCDLDVAQSNIAILSQHYSPDLVDGYIFSPYLYIPAANHHVSKWAKISRISLQDQSQGQQISASILNDKAVYIAPGQTIPIIAALSTDSNPIVSPCSDVELTLKISTSDGPLTQFFTLRCRKMQESFIFTFLDHDGSVQHAAAIRPLQTCSEGMCPTLLTLHGTTVPAQNQADSYKRGGKDNQFIFGLEKAWVLAPTRFV